MLKLCQILREAPRESSVRVDQPLSLITRRYGCTLGLSSQIQLFFFVVFPICFSAFQGHRRARFPVVVGA